MAVFLLTVGCSGVQVKQPEQRLLAKVVTQYAVMKVMERNPDLKDNITTVTNGLIAALENGTPVEIVKDLAVKQAMTSDKLDATDKVFIMNLIEIASNSIVVVAEETTLEKAQIAIEILKWVREAVDFAPIEIQTISKQEWLRERSQESAGKADFDLKAYEEELVASLKAGGVQ